MGIYKCLFITSSQWQYLQSVTLPGVSVVALLLQQWRGLETHQPGTRLLMSSLGAALVSGISRLWVTSQRFLWKTRPRFISVFCVLYGEMLCHKTARVVISCPHFKCIMRLYYNQKKEEFRTIRLQNNDKRYLIYIMTSPQGFFGGFFFDWIVAHFTMLIKTVDNISRSKFTYILYIIRIQHWEKLRHFVTSHEVK